MARTKKKNGADAAPMTTSQMLGSLLKSARDIMRKDKGLNGDLDRLPLLTWIMFLKFLDDLEQQRKEEAALSGKKFKAAIEAPYRWRDWAADPQGITGDELLAFINADEAVRADAKKGPGLFAYLRSLSSSNGDRARGRQEGSWPVRLLAFALKLKWRQPPRRDRHGVQGCR
jgi:type I restriction enzyme M protein